MWCTVRGVLSGPSYPQHTLFVRKSCYTFKTTRRRNSFLITRLSYLFPISPRSSIFFPLFVSKRPLYSRMQSILGLRSELGPIGSNLRGFSPFQQQQYMESGRESALSSMIQLINPFDSGSIFGRITTNVLTGSGLNGLNLLGDNNGMNWARYVPTNMTSSPASEENGSRNATVAERNLSNEEVRTDCRRLQIVCLQGVRQNKRNRQWIKNDEDHRRTDHQHQAADQQRIRRGWPGRGDHLLL